MTDVERARFVHDALPPGGLFADQHWRISPRPFALEPKLAAELEGLGRVLLQFYRAVNLLYRRSVEGKAPEWVASLLDQGKPQELIAWQRHAGFKSDVPRVIRPDVLLTEDGIALSELDSVPGGIGLTQWLNETYGTLASLHGEDPGSILGGPTGMKEGFAGIFGDAASVALVVSDESASYRPEMTWLAGQMDPARFRVLGAADPGWASAGAVYRFFELFDLGNVPVASALFERAASKQIRLTPPPKPIFEEKLLFALLWNRNLRPFWRQELGEGFLQRLLKMVPQTWVVDPTPLPPHAAYPGLDLTEWSQLKLLSQRDRDLILKISGYSEQAWGARGVSLGSDLSTADWSAAVDEALERWPRSPYVLQRYHKPRQVASSYVDLNTGATVPMPARVRLCPYYFVTGDADAARPKLGGVLATICPADKKIIHGMKDAVLAPCVVEKPA